MGKTTLLGGNEGFDFQFPLFFTLLLFKTACERPLRVKLFKREYVLYLLFNQL